MSQPSIYYKIMKPDFWHVCFLVLFCRDSVQAPVEEKETEATAAASVQQEEAEAAAPKTSLPTTAMKESTTTAIEVRPR